MVKSIQTKIILIFFILGLVIIGSLSAFYIGSIKQLQTEYISQTSLENFETITTEK